MLGANGIGGRESGVLNEKETGKSCYQYLQYEKRTKGVEKKKRERTNLRNALSADEPLDIAEPHQRHDSDKASEHL